MEVFQSKRSLIKRREILIVVVVLSTIFTACKKDAPITVDFGYNFVPLSKGNYVIYDVDSIYFDDFTKKSDTFKLQLKEQIGDSFTDLTGNTSYEYKRYKRYYTANVDINTVAWTLTDVWYVTKLKDRFERVEESFRYSRLKFPVIEGTMWNGNAFNNEEEWEYILQKVDDKAKIGAFTFDSTATVLQRDEESKISKQYYKEIYARNLGLIYKRVIDVHSQNTSSQVNIMNKIEKGVIFEWRYLSHGNN